MGVNNETTSVKKTPQHPPSDRSPWHWPEQAGAYVLAVSIFTTLGPFGTFEMPFGWRLLYWALALASGWVFVASSIMTMRGRGFLHVDAPLARFAIAIIVAAPPTAMVVLLLESLLRPENGGFWKPEVFFYVAVVCLAVGGAVVAYVRPRFTLPGRDPTYPEFFKRLPPHLGTNLISLSSQDHYVEVVTDKGTELIHMRLSDALEDLKDYPGQQIHRSHWIAARAFLGTTRENKRLVVRLSDGRTLPVSRSYATEVRAMTPANPE